MARKTHYRRIQAKQKEAIVLLSGGMVEHIYLKVLIRELKISNLLNSNFKPKISIRFTKIFLTERLSLYYLLSSG